MTDLTENKFYTYEVWTIKINIAFEAFVCTYIWVKCREISRTNLINASRLFILTLENITYTTIAKEL